MKLMQLLNAMMLTALILSPLAAEDAAEAANKCDQVYDACLEKCEAAEESSEKCYDACDSAHEACLIAAQEKE